VLIGEEQAWRRDHAGADDFSVGRTREHAIDPADERQARS
jgi:hypothetical protein